MIVGSEVIEYLQNRATKCQDIYLTNARSLHLLRKRLKNAGLVSLPNDGSNILDAKYCVGTKRRVFRMQNGHFLELKKEWNRVCNWVKVK